MFDIFLVTYWIEVNNVLHQKIYPKPVRSCTDIVKHISSKIKKPVTLKAVSCDEPKIFFEKRKDKNYGHAYKPIR